MPLQYSSFHTFTGTTASSSQVYINIQEKSRSVKAVFAMQKRPTSNYKFDAGASFFSTGASAPNTLQEFQYRIGNRYFPAAPVQTSQSGSSQSNGGVEAYVELAKALNILGDDRLSTNVNLNTWGTGTRTIGTTPGYLGEYDYSTSKTSTQNVHVQSETASTVANKAQYNSFAGTSGSSNFCMAINLETNNGNEIAGLNAEEQSDICLIAKWSAPQVLGAIDSGPANIEVFTHYDAMIVLRENNVIELIQ